MVRKEQVILIVPVGQMDTEILAHLGSALTDIFHLPVNTAGIVALPPQLYNRTRRQYYSSPILNMLKPLKSPEVFRLLAVVDEDLYVPSLNFVFGEADVESGVAIISLARLRNELYGKQADNKLFFERTVKEAVHELGHTFGLSHCRDSRCIMFFSNTLNDTDRKGPVFCADCREKVSRRSG